MNFGLINKHTVLPNFCDFCKNRLGRKGTTFLTERKWNYIHALTARAVFVTKERPCWVCALFPRVHHLQSCWLVAYHNLKTSSSIKMIYRCKVCHFLFDLEFVLHNTPNEDGTFSHACFLLSVYCMLHLIHVRRHEWMEAWMTFINTHFPANAWYS